MKIIVLMESSDDFESAERLQDRISGSGIPSDEGTGDVVVLVPYVR